MAVGDPLNRVLDRLDDETRELQVEADADLHAWLDGAISPRDYRRFLTRTYGFLRPLELSLSETTDLDRFFDPRQLRKHHLLAHDLETLGMKVRDIEALPQCMAIPLFETVHEALGWLYVVERSTLGHATLFRHLAGALPGEVAFASRYLKCYVGAAGEMWRSFGARVEASIAEPRHADRIVDAAKASFHNYRRWQTTHDGQVIAPEQGRSEAS
jgi:heme oxygenase